MHDDCSAASARRLGLQVPQRDMKTDWIYIGVIVLAFAFAGWYWFIQPTCERLSRDLTATQLRECGL